MARLAQTGARFLASSGYPRARHFLGHHLHRHVGAAAIWGQGLLQLVVEARGLLGVPERRAVLARLRATLPTIRLLLERGASVVLLSHLHYDHLDIPSLAAIGVRPQQALSDCQELLRLIMDRQPTTEASAALEAIHRRYLAAGADIGAEPVGPPAGVGPHHPLARPRSAPPGPPWGPAWPTGAGGSNPVRSAPVRRC